MPSFQNTLLHLHRRVGMKYNWGWDCWCIYTGKGLADPSHPRTQLHLPHIRTHVLHVGCCPPQPISVLGPRPAPTPSTVHPFGPGHFSSQTFSHINTPTFSSPVIQSGAEETHVFQMDSTR